MVNFSSIDMDHEKAKELIKTSATNVGAKIELSIMPMAADSEPINFYGVSQKPIFGQVAEFRLWDTHGKKLYFFYQADWYKEHNDLQELYRR
jgi:hypothetical protein